MVERIPKAAEPVDADDRWLDTPNCPSCLHAMEPAETASGDVFWQCRFCGQRGIA